jgi:hypothetical protein
LTLLQALTLALGKVGILGAGEVPSSDDQSDALLEANLCVDEWNGDPAAQTQQALVSVALNSAPSYVLGARPLQVTGAYAVNSGGMAEPVKVVTDAAEFGALAPEQNLTANWPRAVFVNYGFPTATIYVAPLSSGTLYLSTVNPVFTPFSGTGDTITFPPGYTNLLVLELCVKRATAYGKAVPDSVMADYQSAKAAVGARNQISRAGAPPETAPQQ